MPDQDNGIAPTTPLTVTLEAQQWNQILAVLTKAPYEIAAPLIQNIMGQVQKEGPPRVIESANIERHVNGAQ
jgi:hypothetical protein